MKNNSSLITQYSSFAEGDSYADEKGAPANG